MEEGGCWGGWGLAGGIDPAASNAVLHAPADLECQVKVSNQAVMTGMRKRWTERGINFPTEAIWQHVIPLEQVTVMG